jgi:hypothetical protein
MPLLQDLQAKCPNEVASRDVAAIAAAFNAGRTRLVPVLGGIGLVMETLGPEGGAALLDGLEAMSAQSSAIKWGLRLINMGQLDFGAVATRGMIEQLVATQAIPQPAADALLALAVVPDPVSERDVMLALYDAAGNWLGDN